MERPVWRSNSMLGYSDAWLTQQGQDAMQFPWDWYRPHILLRFSWQWLLAPVKFHDIMMAWKNAHDVCYHIEHYARPAFTMTWQRQFRHIMMLGQEVTIIHHNSSLCHNCWFMSYWLGMEGEGTRYHIRKAHTICERFCRISLFRPRIEPTLSPSKRMSCGALKRKEKEKELL